MNCHRRTFVLRQVSISVHGTGSARVRGHARSHRDHAIHFRIEHDSCLCRYGMPLCLRLSLEDWVIREESTSVNGTGFAGVRG